MWGLQLEERTRDLHLDLSQSVTEAARRLASPLEQETSLRSAFSLAYPKHPQAIWQLNANDINVGHFVSSLIG